MELKGTRTEQNLKAAFCDESTAYRRYTLYADEAKAGGYDEIAEIFRKTAEQEGVHARMWLHALSDVGDLSENLRRSADTEKEGWASRYEQFARDAEEEGFAELSARFRAVGKIEERHGDVFRHLLREVGAQSVFEKKEDTLWECRACGHLAVGKGAPRACAVCASPRGCFRSR